MGRFSDQLQALAMEEDSDKRLELASALDNDTVDLEENWGNRDAYNTASAELETAKADLAAAVADRDTWKTRYADRFFAAEPPTEPRQQPQVHRTTYDNLWD